MINLLDTIKETIIIEEFKLINAEIINESLNCKLLQDLARQLYKGRKEDQERLDKEYEDEVNKGYKYASKNTSQNKIFKQIFGNENILWDKITDKDIEEYPATEDEKEQRKMDKKIREVIKGTKKILISKNKDGEFTYFIDCWGSVYNLKKGTSWNLHQGSRVSGYRGKDIPQYEKIDLIKGQTIYIIDYSSFERAKIQGERNRAKSGRIMMDPESLKRIAEQNIERYKKIIRDNKAKHINNDELINKCKKIINQVASYATMIAKDPIRHADLIADVSQLTKYIYDTKVYHSPKSYKDKGWYSGVDGILPMMMKYTKTLSDISKNGGAYEYQSTDVKNAQKAMEGAVKKAEELIQKIDDKMNE